MDAKYYYDIVDQNLSGTKEIYNEIIENGKVNYTWRKGAGLFRQRLINLHIRAELHNLTNTFFDENKLEKYKHPDTNRIVDSISSKLRTILEFKKVPTQESIDIQKKLNELANLPSHPEGDYITGKAYKLYLKCFVEFIQLLTGEPCVSSVQNQLSESHPVFIYDDEDGVPDFNKNNLLKNDAAPTSLDLVAKRKQKRKKKVDTQKEIEIESSNSVDITDNSKYETETIESELNFNEELNQIFANGFSRESINILVSKVTKEKLIELSEFYFEIGQRCILFKLDSNLVEEYYLKSIEYEPKAEIAEKIARYFWFDCNKIELALSIFNLYNAKKNDSLIIGNRIFQYHINVNVINVNFSKPDLLTIVDLNKINDDWLRVKYLMIKCLWRTLSNLKEINYRIEYKDKNLKLEFLLITYVLAGYLEGENMFYNNTLIKQNIIDLTNSGARLDNFNRIELFKYAYKVFHRDLNFVLTFASEEELKIINNLIELDEQVKVYCNEIYSFVNNLDIPGHILDFGKRYDKWKTAVLNAQFKDAMSYFNCKISYLKNGDLDFFNKKFNGGVKVYDEWGIDFYNPIKGIKSKIKYFESAIFGKLIHKSKINYLKNIKNIMISFEKRRYTLMELGVPSKTSYNKQFSEVI